jgi:hypothetical protein
VRTVGFAVAVVLAAACRSSSPKTEPPPPAAATTTTPTTATPSPASTSLPPGIGGRIELPSATLVAGSTEPGSLVMENGTGAPLRLTTGGPGACEPGWTVILTSPQLPQEAAFATGCLPRPMVVRAGETRLPFTLRSAYQACSETGHAQSALIPVCVKDANGRDVSPPLPPGNYRATFFSNIGRFIPVESVPVRVVASG